MTIQLRFQIASIYLEKKKTVTTVFQKSLLVMLWQI